MKNRFKDGLKVPQIKALLNLFDKM